MMVFLNVCLQMKKTNNIMASSYYMNNRKKFVSFINSIFEPYKRELDNLENSITCESMEQGSDSSKINLLIHQQIVRDYLNLHTPYRGLLLYHGLGSGKTCSSIAIADRYETSSTSCYYDTGFFKSQLY